MNDFIISTETSSDFSIEYIQQNNIKVIPLYYSIEGKVFEETAGQDFSEFYNNIRQGAKPQTMAVNPEAVEKHFRSILDEGYDLLHIAFSSALSSTYNTLYMVGQQLQEEYPENKIYVIDSKCASLGEGFLVGRAAKLKKQGKTIEEVRDWLEENKLNICHEFTVDDLNYLQRGGRISKTTAVVGTLINVKPIMHVDDEGRLVQLYNVRGRKKSIVALVDNMVGGMKGVADKNDEIFICHGDCFDDATRLAELVKERTGIEKIYINSIGAVIGSHSGPGTLAVFYYGKSRNESVK